VPFFVRNGAVLPAATPASVAAPVSTSVVKKSSLQPPSPTPTDDSRAAIQTTIERFFEIKTQALRTLDDSAFEAVLQGAALERVRNSLNTLRSKNCYWIFSNRIIQFNHWELVNPNYAVVYTRVREDANLYCNGRLDPGSYYDPYNVRFELERINGRWFITNRTILSE